MTRRLVAAAVAAMLALVGVAMSVEAGTVRAVTISTATAGPEVPFKAFDGHNMKVFDIDGDGNMEIIAHNDNRRVYVFDSTDGTMLAELTTKYPGTWGARSINSPEVAITVFGGLPHLVIANSAAYITMFRFDPGTSTPGHFDFTKVWEKRLDDCHAQPSMDAAPVLYDLDGDGDLEILAQTEEVGVFALHHDGSVMWRRCIGGGNAAPAVGDLDFGGIPEVVWVSDSGVVSVVNGMTGATRWTFWAGAPSFDLGAASIPVAPAIGQVDGAGNLDIVFGARDSHDAEDFTNNHAALFALRGEGSLLWMRQDSQAAPLTYTTPVIVDIDDDGEADIFWADWNTVGHKPPFPGDPVPPWSTTGPAHFYRYDGGGDLRWRTTLSSFWNNNDLAIADVDGDGVQEVLASGPGNTGEDGIWYLNALTGARESHVSTHPWKVTRGPVVEDMWGLGTTQWAVPVSANDPSVAGGAVLVFDTGTPFDAVYPHAPYPEAANGTGSGGDTFPAVFTVPSSVNEWWVEVKVASAHTVTAVSARVDGGAPVTLSKTGWGTWAKSFFVQGGSQVVFTATNTLGDSATSATFSWLGDPPPPPPPSENFTAAFTVPSSVNNWWVEVKVNANAPVTSVTASVDGGAHVALSPTSWGTWAKSFFVESGRPVVFTAFDGTGASVTSEAFPWLGAPPPAGDLEATFTVPSSVNQWWVEVKVTANKPLDGVTATANGGAPVALSKTGWGTWAKSFFVEAGSTVRFDATAGAETASSEDFTWLTSGGPFDATFKVGDTTNNWWVEVMVTATKPLDDVTASVDGGGPVALSKTGWGTWAKSFFVPDGASVVFTATAGADSKSSAPVVWG